MRPAHQGNSLDRPWRLWCLLSCRLPTSLIDGEAKTTIIVILIINIGISIFIFAKYKNPVPEMIARPPHCRRGHCVNQRVSHAARLYPHAPAVQWVSSLEPASVTASISYADLESLATSAANLLAQQGVNRNMVVALAVPDGVALVLLQLAVLKNGAAFSPIDPKLPANRIAFLLTELAAANARAANARATKDTKVLVIARESDYDDIHTAALEAKLKADVAVTVATAEELGVAVNTCTKEPIVAVNTSCESASKLTADLCNGDCNGEDDGDCEHDCDCHLPCHMICTSGSTGNPKCVVVQHFALSTYTELYSHTMCIGRHQHGRSCNSSRVLLASAATFDPSIG